MRVRSYYGSQGNGHRNNRGPLLGGKAMQTTFSIREVGQVKLGPEFFLNPSKTPLKPLVVSQVRRAA